MTAIPPSPSSTPGRSTAPSPVPSGRAGDRAAAPAVPVPMPGAATPAFSAIGTLLSALEHPDPARPVALPAPDSALAREVQALLARRLETLMVDAGVPTRMLPRLEVADDAQVRVDVSDPRAPVLQARVDREPDVQALARLLHAIRTSPAAPPPTQHTLREIEASGPEPPRTASARRSSAPAGWPWPWSPAADARGAGQIPPWVWIVVAVVAVLIFKL